MNNKVFDREQNELRTLRKAQQTAYSTKLDKEEVAGLLLTDAPEFADMRITTLAADGALGNSAKSVKSYLTKLWEKLTAHSDLTITAHGGIVAGSDTRLTDTRPVKFVAVPASATAAGTAGSVAYDSGYLYICTATNTWKRTALTTW